MTGENCYVCVCVCICTLGYSEEWSRLMNNITNNHFNGREITGGTD